jgi:hypothetical protein
MRNVSGPALRFPPSKVGLGVRWLASVALAVVGGFFLVAGLIFAVAGGGHVEQPIAPIALVLTGGFFTALVGWAPIEVQLDDDWIVARGLCWRRHWPVCAVERITISNDRDGGVSRVARVGRSRVPISAAMADHLVGMVPELMVIDKQRGTKKTPKR